MYPKCFDDIGKFKDFEYHNVQPVKHSARKVALSVQPKLKKELKSLVEQGIIMPVDGPHDWINSLEIEEKLDGR